MWINSFKFLKKSWKTWFLALVGLTEVKGRSVRKQVTKKDRKGRVASPSFWDSFWSKFNQKCNRKLIKKMITKQHGILCQRGPKMEPKSMPNSSKINFKICNEKDHENHQKSCLSEW